MSPRGQLFCFFSFPSSTSFSYGNPSSSSELLGSSINQRLYEIPAGAKGQRRKLAAVFSSPFMLAVGLIAKCAISLISTLKQTPPTSWGGAVCPRLHFMALDFILRGRRRRRRGGRKVGAPTPAYCHPSPFFFASTHPVMFRCGRANSGACSSHSASLTHFSSDGAAVMIGGLSLRFHSEEVLLINTRPGELCWPFHSRSLCYSPGLLLGPPNSWNTHIFGPDVALLADSSRRKVFSSFSKCAEHC